MITTKSIDRASLPIRPREGAREAPTETGCARNAACATPANSLRARRRQPIDDIIDDCDVRTLYQPIVHLESGAVVAFEALSRGPDGSQLESPIAMLNAAREVDRLGELDWLCRVTAMRNAAAAGFPASVSWFINVEPAGLRTDCPDHLRATLDRARTELRVILEVPERELEVHVADLLSATDEARNDSWGVALDDIGAQEDSLALLPLLQPDVVKLDMSLLREVPVDASVEVVGAVHAYAERTGAVIVAEGIETDEQQRLACALGASYGQGYLYGRPGSLPVSLPEPRNPVPLRQRPEPCDDTSPFDIAASHVSPKRSLAKHLMPFLTHMLDHCGRATEAAVLLTVFDDEDHYRARADAYDEFARSNAFTVCLVPGTDIRRDEPRFHVGAPPANSPLASEWGVTVLAPHFAAALLLRNVGPPTDEPNEVDYIFTHDRTVVVAAARAFVHHMNNDRARRASESQARSPSLAQQV
jgi:EAL domain-containing protein (putative c-di-GMP-specific phosphodiesterase class I)